MKRWLLIGPAVATVFLGAARAGDDPPKQEDAKQVKAAPILPKSADAKKDAQGDAAPKTPLAQVQALENEYNAATQSFMKEYRAAKTDAERNKLFSKYPQPDKYAPRFLKIAQAHPDDPAAIEAYVWLLSRTRGPESEKAIEALTAHPENPKVAAAVPMLQYAQSEKAVVLLRAILAKNPSRDAQGGACLALARRLMTAPSAPGVDPAKNSAEAEALFDRVIKDYADIKVGGRSIADQAKGELFEVKHLSVGKNAPDIVGKDLADKSLKLSDYRGKIVMLDFWGDW